MANDTELNLDQELRGMLADAWDMGYHQAVDDGEEGERLRANPFRKENQNSATD